jgi:hypothetical protein
MNLPVQARIELLAASRDPDASLADLAKFRGSNEATDSGLYVVNESLVSKFDLKLTAIFFAASFIFSTLISEKPLTLSSLLVVVAMRLYKAV